MFIIAEIAQAHDGSLGIAHSYIDALVKTGVDAIKFQTHIAEAESSKYEPFRTNFSYEDKSRFDYWKRMEFSFEQWQSLKQHCDEVGLEFMSTPFSNEAVNLLEEIGINRYKIGSGDTTNFLLLEKIALTGKPVILSSGMSNYRELDKSISFLKGKGIDLSVMQATTAYPTQAENYGLNIITEIKQKYQIPVGFSDHSAKIETGIAAFVLGAELLEFHVVFDKRMFGPDSVASLTIDEAKKMVDAIRNLEKAFKNPVNKELNNQYIDLKNIFEKSLAVNKNLKKGHKLQFEDLEAKKPKHAGILSANYKNIIGAILKKDLKKWDFITENDITYE